MTYQFEELDNLYVLSVDTLMLDYENHQLLREVESMIAEGNRFFVINLEQLAFINSVGLSFLIAVLTKSRNAGGETVIANVSEKITQLLVMTKLKSIFKVSDSLDEAIDSIKEEMLASTK